MYINIVQTKSKIHMRKFYSNHFDFTCQFYVPTTTRSGSYMNVLNSDLFILHSSKNIRILTAPPHLPSDHPTRSLLYPQNPLSIWGTFWNVPLLIIILFDISISWATRGDLTRIRNTKFKSYLLPPKSAMLLHESL